MSRSILDPKFKYTPAASTDIRKTFARVRREMKARAQGNVYDLSGRDKPYVEYKGRKS